MVGKLVFPGTIPIDVELPTVTESTGDIVDDLSAADGFARAGSLVNSGAAEFDSAVGSVLATSELDRSPCRKLKITIPTTPSVTTAPAAPSIIFQGGPLV